MDKDKVRVILKKIWHFIWKDDSIWSWIVNVILAFVLIKFIVYPGLGLILSTKYPIVAVVSGSMEHDKIFDEWWDSQKGWYLSYNITKDQFLNFDFKNGFNKGDIMILYGTNPSRIEIGDVIVFRTYRPDPIIHRVVRKWKNNDKYYFQTKGDHNIDSIGFEKSISEKSVLGKAYVRIPLLGYIKIWFVELISLFR